FVLLFFSLPTSTNFAQFLLDFLFAGTPYIFLYTLNLYLVKCRQHHGSAFGWTIPTKHHSRQQKTF
ncbi:hypothetical protein, partial [Allofournierella massiliensis]|uniref:hypothetical protein n=1 Tax=Allofournierella massiliensis TaxID=1650663 RepID=UPI003569BFAF